MARLFRQRFMRPDKEAEDPKQPITDCQKAASHCQPGGSQKRCRGLNSQHPQSIAHTGDPCHTPSTHFCHPHFQDRASCQPDTFSQQDVVCVWGERCHRIPKLRASQSRKPLPMSISIKSPESQEMLKPCGPCLRISSLRGGCDPPEKGASKPPAVCPPPGTLSSRHDVKVPLLDRILLGYKEQIRTLLTRVPVDGLAPCTGMSHSTQTPWAVSQGAMGPLLALVSPKATCLSNQQCPPLKNLFHEVSILEEDPFPPTKN